MAGLCFLRKINCYLHIVRRNRNRKASPFTWQAGKTDLRKMAVNDGFDKHHAQAYAVIFDLFCGFSIA